MPNWLRPVRIFALSAILAAVSLAWSAPAEAAEPIRVMLDGRQLSFDVPPVIENGFTLVPLRAILEPLGATVTWVAAEQRILANQGTMEINMVVGVKAAVASGTTVMLDIPPRIQDGRTLIPLRFVAEHLGVRVGWDGATRTITMQSRGGSIASRDGSTTSRTGQWLVDQAGKYVGSRYAWGGISPETGFDCSGFMYFLGKLAGIELPRTSMEQFTAGVAVDRANLRAGDLVFFTTYAPGASHAGIYDGQGNFIHAGNEGKGVIVTPLSRAWWSERYLGARRIVR